MLRFTGNTDDVVVETASGVFPRVIGCGLVGRCAVAEVPCYVLSASDDRQGHFKGRASGFNTEIQGEICGGEYRNGQRIGIGAAQVVVSRQGNIVRLNSAVRVECLRCRRAIVGDSVAEVPNVGVCIAGDVFEVCGQRLTPFQSVRTEFSHGLGSNVNRLSVRVHATEYGHPCERDGSAHQSAVGVFQQNARSLFV